MSLLTDFDLQVRRIRSYTERDRRNRVDLAARPCLALAQTLLRRGERLRRLESLPTDLLGPIDPQLQAVRIKLRKAIDEWSALDIYSVSVERVMALHETLQRADRDLERHMEAMESAVRTGIQNALRQERDTAFLARELGVDAPEMVVARAAFHERLTAMHEVTEGRATAIPDDWEQVRRTFERVASARVCLRRAHLATEAGELVTTLLGQGAMRLDAIDPDALLALARFPALARLCRLSLPREDDE
jgi:hypothetical protein